MIIESTVMSIKHTKDNIQILRLYYSTGFSLYVHQHS